MNNFFSSKIIIKNDYILNKFLDIINGVDINESYLLYLQKNEFNDIEKIIYDLAMIHIEKKNIELSDKLFIEFKVESIINSSMDIVYDKFNKKINKSNEIIYPFLTTITYIDDIEIPDIITDIDIENFKYKDFSNNKLYFSFPSFLKHNYFEGGKYYSNNCNLLKLINKERKVLRMNLWNVCPLNIPYYMNSQESYVSFNKSEKILQLDYTNQGKHILLNDIKLDNTFFEKIMYNNEVNDFDIIVEYIKNDYKNFDYLIVESQQQKGKEIVKKKIIDTSLNKFSQRFIFKNKYDKFICDYIMSESIHLLNDEKNVINLNNYKVINIEIIKNIISLVIKSFEIFIKNIINSYCLTGNKDFSIIDICIIKNDCTEKINVFNEETSSINICLLLNSKFDGGNILFEDELEYKLDKGDMIIFKGSSSYSYLPIKEGTQYILFGRINIYE